MKIVGLTFENKKAYKVGEDGILSIDEVISFSGHLISYKVQYSTGWTEEVNLDYVFSVIRAL